MHENTFAVVSAPLWLRTSAPSFKEKDIFPLVFIEQINFERSGSFPLASGPCPVDIGRLRYGGGAADGEQQR